MVLLVVSAGASQGLDLIVGRLLHDGWTKSAFGHGPLKALLIALDAVHPIRRRELLRQVPENLVQANLRANRFVFHELANFKLMRHFSLSV